LSISAVLPMCSRAFEATVHIYIQKKGMGRLTRSLATAGGALAGRLLAFGSPPGGGGGGGGPPPPKPGIVGGGGGGGGGGGIVILYSCF